MPTTIHSATTGYSYIYLNVQRLFSHYAVDQNTTGLNSTMAVRRSISYAGLRLIRGLSKIPFFFCSTFLLHLL